MMLKQFNFLLLLSLPLVCYGQAPPQGYSQSPPTPAPTRGWNEGCEFDHDSISDENEISIYVTPGVSAFNDGYWRVNFLTGQFAGMSNVMSWCVDMNRTLSTGTYSVDLYSSMNETHVIPPDTVDLPENFGGVNYLINNNFIGTIVHCPSDPTTAYTVKSDDLQNAIWDVIDNSGVQDYSTTPNQCVVDILADLALENLDYIPNCHDYDAKVAVMSVHDVGEDGEINKQVIISEIAVRDTDICDCGGGAFGDPHIKTWTGENYDFHGVCDLVLMSNPGFKNGQGIDIHIRSKRTRLWSYISSAAVRIGEDVLEVVGGKNVNKFWINGIEHEVLPESKALTFSGYQMSYKQVSNTVRDFFINLGGGEQVILKTWNSFVSINMKNAKSVDFENSVGLMGSFETGMKFARDGKTILSDMNTLGQEWQVLESERKLFRTEEGPQQPAKCEIISGAELRRQLGESTIAMEDAKNACTDMGAGVLDSCIFDVMATNDLSVAESYKM